jgi:signal transduction histidine kinase
VQAVLDGKMIHIPNVERLTEQSQSLRERLLGRGVRSFLGLPIQVSPDTVGLLALEAHGHTVHWNDQQIAMYRLLGKLFGNAFRRLQDERALKESQLQLMHAQKMEAVGRLAGSIAHDFNNLLTVILGYNRSMLVETSENTPLREDAESIADAAERAAGLTIRALKCDRSHDRSALR